MFSKMTQTTIKYKDLLLRENNVINYNTWYNGVDITNSLPAYGAGTPVLGTYDKGTFFRLIYDNFCNSEIAYDTPEAFIRHFNIKVSNVIGKYFAKLYLINKTYKLTDDELITVNSTLAQIANNQPETNTTGLDSPLSYFDQQTGTKTRENKLNAYIKAITLLRDNTLEDTITELQPLFIRVLQPTNYFFMEE